MAVVLQINYTPSEAQNAQRQDDILAAAENVAKSEGVIWKIWIHNAGERLRGGIYLFETEAQARAWGEDRTRPALLEAGAQDVSIRIFDINLAPSRVTRAPLDRTPATA